MCLCLCSLHLKNVGEVEATTYELVSSVRIVYRNEMRGLHDVYSDSRNLIGLGVVRSNLIGSAEPCGPVG